LGGETLRAAATPELLFWLKQETLLSQRNCGQHPEGTTAVSERKQEKRIGDIAAGKSTLTCN